MMKLSKKLFIVLIPFLLAIIPHLATAQSIEQVMKQGYTAVKLGDYAEAENIFRKVVQLSPKNAAGYIGLGIVRDDQDKIVEAISFYQQALQIDPNNTVARQLLRLILDEQKDSVRQRQYLLKGVDAQIKSIEEQIRGADKLMASYRQIIQLWPNKPKYYDTYIDLGNALIQRNQLDAQLVELWRQAKQLNPNYIVTYNLSDVLTEEKRLDEAITIYRRAIQLKPNAAEAYYYLGNAMYEQNKLAEAIAAYQKAIKLDPKDTFALNKLRKAQWQLEQRQS